MSDVGWPASDDSTVVMPAVRAAPRGRGVIVTALAGVAGAVDGYDGFGLLGLVLLGVGLGWWFEPGVALTVVGALMLALAVCGAVAKSRAAAAAATDDVPVATTRGG